MDFMKTKRCEQFWAGIRPKASRRWPSPWPELACTAQTDWCGNTHAGHTPHVLGARGCTAAGGKPVDAVQRRWQIKHRWVRPTCQARWWGGMEAVKMVGAIVFLDDDDAPLDGGGRWWVL
jgi:hypothetical protein